MPMSKEGLRWRRRRPRSASGAVLSRVWASRPPPSRCQRSSLGCGTLTLDQRKLLVDQAIVLLEQNYVHLPLKVAMHAVNPLQRLRLLRTRMDAPDDADDGAEWLFHRQMSAIFHSVRDLHTNYLLPAPFAGKIAFLPFVIEKCSTTVQRRPLPRHPDRRRVQRAAVRRRVSRSRTGTARRSPGPSRSTAPGSPAATRPPTWPADSNR